MRQIVVDIEAGEEYCEGCDGYIPVYFLYRCKYYPRRKLRWPKDAESPRRCAECLRREIEPRGKA
jgi:hypothetical protein